jgi:hypothetical protein
MMNALASISFDSEVLVSVARFRASLLRGRVSITAGPENVRAGVGVMCAVMPPSADA